MTAADGHAELLPVCGAGEALWIWSLLLRRFPHFEEGCLLECEKYYYYHLPESPVAYQILIWLLFHVLPPGTKSPAYAALHTHTHTYRGYLPSHPGPSPNR